MIQPPANGLPPMKDDATFLSNLAVSEEAVRALASSLHGEGVGVFVPPVEVRPSADQRMAFADKGDLILSGLRVEVKHRSFNFKDRDSYPHKTVFIDEKYKFDAKADIPLLCYVNLSHDMKCAAVVYGFTRHRWTLDRRPSKEEGRLIVNYQVDKRWVHFCPPNRLLG